MPVSSVDTVVGVHSAFCEGEASYSQGSRSFLEIRGSIAGLPVARKPHQGRMCGIFPNTPPPVHGPFNCPTSVTMSGEYDPEGMASLT